MLFHHFLSIIYLCQHCFTTQLLLCLGQNHGAIAFCGPKKIQCGQKTCLLRPCIEQAGRAERRLGRLLEEEILAQQRNKTPAAV